MRNDYSVGLRDRKRAQTRARIEAAAIELVLRDGIDAATVDAISERADISSRTFFNYFESKDAAILGLHVRDLDEGARDEGALDAQATAEGHLDAVAAVVGLVTAAIGVVDARTPELHRDRIEIMRRHPEILSGQFAQIHARKSLLREHTAHLLARDPRFRDDADLPARAGIVLALCASAVRSAIENWTQTVGSSDHEAGPDEVAAVSQRAAELVRTTLGRLA